MDNKQTRLLIPQLTPFYDWAEPLSSVLIRITVGLMLLPHGWPKLGWTGPGYEYPLMWGLVMFAVALRGGGAWSLDRRIGREL
ncbi:MAG: hypothetical protein OEW21_19075 [Betaproteobacteria bacterium]|nr:hypothetical protein [Betaproteobacteria bacterium]